MIISLKDSSEVSPIMDRRLRRIIIVEFSLLGLFWVDRSLPSLRPEKKLDFRQVVLLY